MQEQKLTQNNPIIVRIWTSQFNRERKGESVGHVSIETTQPQSYISLWPQEQNKNNLGFFKPIPAEYKETPDEDFSEEKRAAEITVCLYSLNSELLSEHFTQERERLEGWVLIGHNRLINQGTGDSCSGLAYRLLKTAGIYDQLLSHGNFSSTFSSVVTPDDLGKALSVAKRKEIALYPETADFHHAEETPLNDLPGAQSQKLCTIL